MEQEGLTSTAKFPDVFSCAGGFCENRTTSAYETPVIVATTSAAPSPDITVDPAVALSAVGIAIAVTGMAANVVSFAAALSARCRNHGQRLGLINLSAASFLAAVGIVANLSFAIHWVVAKHWEHPDEAGVYRQEWCANEVFKWIITVSSDSNLFVLAFLAVQQFASIRWPLKYGEGTSKRSCYASLAAAWVAGSAYGLARPAVVATATSGHPNVELWPTKGTTRFCYQLVLYEARDSANRLKYPFGQAERDMGLLMLRVAIQCSVLATIVVTYGYILVVIGRSFQRSGPTGASASTAVTNRQRSSHRAVGVIALVTSLMVACYWPMFVYIALQHLERIPRNEPLAPIALYCLMAVSTVADPLIYTFRLKSMRKGAAKIFSKCLPSVCRKVQSRSSFTSKTSATRTLSSSVL